MEISMTDARVIKATYTEWRMIKTRKVLQLVLEIPLEQQGDVLTRLGPPMPDQEKWVAVALLDELVAQEAEQKPKDLDRSLTGKQRYANSSAMEQARDRAAYRLPKDTKFRVWAAGFSPYPLRDEADVARFIRDRCGVDSRAEIATDPDAYREFIEMETAYKIDTEQFAEIRG
jgi:hypothetical protein